jgi:hypothetical protein
VTDCLIDFLGFNERFDTGYRPITSHNWIVENDELEGLTKILSQLCLVELGKTMKKLIAIIRLQTEIRI